MSLDIEEDLPVCILDSDSPEAPPPPKVALTSKRSPALHQSMTEVLEAMKGMVATHQATLSNVDAQLAAHQAEADRARKAEQEKWRTLLLEQQQWQQREMDKQLRVAEEREEKLLARYRAEWEELRQRYPEDRPREQVRTLASLVEDVPPDTEDEEWEDIHHPASSEDELAPTEPMAPQPKVPRLSPPDDAPSFVQLVNRAAHRFELKMETPDVPSSYLTEKLDEPSRTVTALPLEPLIWNAGKEILRAPTLAPAVHTRVDKKYRLAASAPKCFHGQPSPKSIITAAAKGTAQVPSHLLSPPTKEAKRLDNVGKKVLSSASAQIRTANYTAVLARYDRDQWDTIEELLQDLPEERQERAHRVLAEGRLLSNTPLVKAALDTADTAFRQMTNGVWLRRSAWLSTSAFTPDVQQAVLDLPFDGDMLFGEEVHRLLKEEKEDKETIRAMAPLTRG